MRLLRALIPLALVITPQTALACGAMVSESGDAELTGFEALLRWEDGTEELLISAGFTSSDPTFGWLMPLPSAPEIEEGDPEPIRTAFELTEPPVEPAEDEGEGAGAPVVGGAPGVDVIGRDTVGGLRFVTLGGTRAGDVRRWMRKHDFGFHDRQEPVLQDYLDRGWVVIAARVAPGQRPGGSLVPVRFTFGSSEPVYPLAMAGSGHSDLYLAMTLFVLAPYRPSSTTYAETTVTPHPNLAPPLPRRGFELRYSAPLGRDASRLDATPETWLTRYEATIPVVDLTEDLVLGRAADQSRVDFSDLASEDGGLAWLPWTLIPLALVLLAIWISVGMARRRRAQEAARLPGQGPSA